MAFYFYILLLLSGLTGTHSVTTVKKVSVNEGQSLKIPCLYDPKYQRHVKYLCEGENFNSCSDVISSNQSPRPNFSISDDKVQGIFTVTMNQLSIEKRHFWCVVGINNGADDRQYFQLSFLTGTPFLKVNDQEITGFVGGDTSIEFHFTNSRNIKWCRLNGDCATYPFGFIEGTTVIMTTTQRVVTVTMTGLKFGSAGWYLCEEGEHQMPVHVTVLEKPSTTFQVLFHNPRILIIPLSVLIAIVTVTLIVRFMLKRKHKKAEEYLTTKRPCDEREADVSVVPRKEHNAKWRGPKSRPGDQMGKITKAIDSNIENSNERR